jgi:hypothetical protein
VNLIYMHLSVRSSSCDLEPDGVRLQRPNRRDELLLYTIVHVLVLDQ